MLGLKEWIIILLVALVIFGAGKLRNIGSDLGAAIKSFKDGMSDAKKKTTKKKFIKKVK
jgi:sec-independent protein translocase protein TatA